jgi:cytochrome c5
MGSKFFAAAAAAAAAAAVLANSFDVASMSCSLIHQRILLGDPAMHEKLSCETTEIIHTFDM